MSHSFLHNFFLFARRIFLLSNLLFKSLFHNFEKGIKRPSCEWLKREIKINY